jgi:hypothetical protein
MHTAQPAEQIQAKLISSLKKSISTPGKMISVLHPWDDPIPLKRAWCLFELFCAVEMKVEVFFCFSELALSELQDKIASGRGNKNSRRASVEVVRKVDAERANATVAADRDMILSQITKSIGIQQFNSKLEVFMESGIRTLAASLILSGGIKTC